MAMPSQNHPRELAYQACTAIFLEDGRLPTIDLVCERTGNQNRRLTGDVLKTWRKDLAERFREHQLDVPAPIRTLWQQALAEAKKALAAEREALTVERRQLDQERTEQARQREALQARLAERDRLIDTLETEITALKAELERVRSALEQKRADLEAARGDAGRLQGSLTEARTTIEKLEARVDGTLQWATSRIEEERTRIGAEWQREVNRLKNENSRLTLDGQFFEARQRQAEARLDALLEKLSERETEIAGLQADKERLLRENKQIEAARARRAGEAEALKGRLDNLEQKSAKLALEIQEKKAELTRLKPLAQAVRELPRFRQAVTDSLESLDKDFPEAHLHWKALGRLDVSVCFEEGGKILYQIGFEETVPMGEAVEKTLIGRLQMAGFAPVKIIARCASLGTGVPMNSS